jgi:Domain of unknown function (DUF4280)
MGMQVVSGAMMTCSFGAAPSALNVLPVNRTMVGGPPAANIMDFAPVLNIPPFAMCSSPANPTVAAATAAALGVLTPMPCVPMTVAPWIVGAPTVLIGNMPALNDSSKCMCAWGGVISFSMPGQFQTQIP